MLSPNTAAFYPRVLSPILLLSACGWCPDPLYEIITPNPVVQLPIDESPHCIGGEWWYYTGYLATEDSRRYGIEAVIFHLPLLAVDQWAAHYAVLDEANGNYVFEQSLRTALPISPGGAPPSGFNLSTSLIQMSGSQGHDQIQAAMPDGSYAMNLTLSDLRGPVLHGPDGYVPFGADGWSFYYSRPRMAASGTLLINGQRAAVTGEIWFDRQWGRDLNNPWLPWDWFSIRLDDGSDIMLFVFPDGTPQVAFGSYIPPNGQRVELADTDFSIHPITWWTSPHTGITYPVRWVIRILPQELTLTVAAVAEDQELDVRASTLNIYWEGLCTISGMRAGQPVAGLAYAESTNYPVVSPEEGSGDSNCDGALNVADVSPFVQSIMDPVGYTRDHAGCDIRHADLDGDGRIEGADIARFVSRMTAS